MGGTGSNHPQNGILLTGRDSTGTAPARSHRTVSGMAPEISHTSVMAIGLKVGCDVEQALESLGVPSYVFDATGIVR